VLFSLCFKLVALWASSGSAGKKRRNIAGNAISFHNISAIATHNTSQRASSSRVLQRQTRI
jgi:hypothetical protein